MVISRYAFTLKASPKLALSYVNSFPHDEQDGFDLDVKQINEITGENAQATQSRLKGEDDETLQSPGPVPLGHVGRVGLLSAGGGCSARHVGGGRLGKTPVMST
ncbi:unnamed protein product [Pleuronectes platessa]|uniref:Uncharacterized protein n=1 Tax=Pleuronectes platessa TaxID=8262 RepID=A0A9N7TLH1_PLEPL|nr:unnamed protein product [Pleuronectes platessa]